MLQLLGGAAMMLPFLIINIAGLVISLKKRPYHKHAATIAALAYAVLIMQLLINRSIFIWLEWAKVHDVAIFPQMTDIERLGNIVRYAGYAAYVAIMCSVFIGRKATGGSFEKPSIIVAVSAALLALSLTLDLSQSPNLAMALLFARIGASAALLWALWGWRNDADLLPTPEVQLADQAGKPAGGMFEEVDYVPFVAGVLVLAGLIAVPILWSMFLDMEYPSTLFSSLLSCGIFIYAHDKRGNFSIIKFLFGMAFILIQIIRTANQYGGGPPMFIAGGVVGLVVMMACGWVGILIARYIRRALARR